MKHTVAGLFMLMICCSTALAQLAGNLRNKSLILVSSSDTIQIDTLPIFKGTLQVKSKGVLLTEGIDYTVDYLKPAIIPKTLAAGSNVSFNYRVVLLDLGKPYSHKDPGIIQKEYKELKNPFLYTPEAQSRALIQSDGVKMNGSLARGLSFGNNQDVVVNSNLNLQLSGKLGNDIDVLAAISDENNPIQPEGNTQQLQDFDRIFIQLSKNKTKVVVGDFEMVRPTNSYFMNYYKKSRGLQAYSSFSIKNGSTIRLGGEGALSRGRFARNVINGLEGNLGPYRLSGTNGELYIIIISGTEAVYLDGERLKRGEQNDYIIDYNTGEITFMPKRVITQYSRIVVEFQYSDRNYARSVFHTNAEFENQGFSIRANYFIEQDSKNQPFLQTLSDSNKAVMASVGDGTNFALAPTAIATKEFSSKKILYRLLDTLGAQQVFVYTGIPNDTVYYEVTFSFVGSGNGDYVQAQSSANGRVFEFISPIGGIKQGSYAPVTLLVTPKSLQMVSVGADVKAIKNTLLTVEVAQSKYDKNLYSAFDKENDLGYGVKVGASNILSLQNKQSDALHVKTEMNYEFVDQNFRYVERYRNVEFDRIWNRQLTNQQQSDTGFQEHILSARTSLNKSSKGSIYYQIGLYDKKNAFNGIQNLAGINFRSGKNALLVESEWLSTQTRFASGNTQNKVERYKGDYNRSIFFLTTGLRIESEQSSFIGVGDSLEQNSFKYNQFTVYTRNNDSTRIRYGIDYTQREDYQPDQNKFKSATLAKSVIGNLEFTQENFNRFSGNFTYREFEVNDTSFTTLKPERTILTRLEYDYAFIKRVFTANTYYQLGSGQELRRDFQFIEVPTGQGIYVWKDFNGDGQEGLNEFVLASANDRLQANYIKVFLPTNTIIRTNSNQFNQTLNINPATIWNNKNGVKRFIARWSNQTALRMDRKTTELDLVDFINPFKQNLTDSNLISVSSIARNTLFFNRSNPTFGFDLNYTQSSNKSFVNNGFDARNREEQGINSRWNINSQLGLNIGYTNGERKYQSDFFAANNYAYSFQEIKPKLIYQITQNLRATILYSYFDGKNRADLGKQTGNNQEAGAEIRYNIAKQGVLNGKYSLFKVRFDGDISSPLGYDMMQGLNPGENMVWNLSYQQRLANNLQINISYDGRKSENQPIIHIGRMEARYLF